MTFITGLKRICDFCFYMTFAGFLGLLLGGDPLMAALPIFSAVSFLSAGLAKRGKLKYAPLPLLLASFAVVPLTIPNVLVLIPPMVYMVYGAPTGKETSDELDYSDVFLLFIKMFVPFALLFLIFWQQDLLARGLLSFGMVFMIGAVFLMRMSRHDEEMLSQHRLKLLNGFSLAFLLSIGLVLSSETALNVIRISISYLYGSVLLPILLFALAVVVRVLAWISALFGFTGFYIPLTLAQREEAELEFEDMNLDLPMYEEGYPPEFLTFLLYAAVAVATVVALVKLYKKLMADYLTDANKLGVQEKRVAIAESSKPSRKKKTGNPIRDIYRKFLEQGAKNGMEVHHFMTSLDIEQQALEAFHCPKSLELREMYIKARYGENTVSKEEAKKAKELYREIMGGKK